MSKISDAYKNNRVGPIFRSGEIANAAVEAVKVDNQGKKINVEDRTAYVRIDTDGELILQRETMEEMLGRPFEIRELEIDLSSFAGQIEISADQVRFYLNKNI